MTEKEFDRGLKLLKRFLKDKGLYQQVFKRFLFKNGKRKPIDLFNEFNSTKFNDVDDWKVLFGRLNLMVGENEPFNFSDYYTTIEGNQVHTQWPKFCRENKL